MTREVSPCCPVCGACFRSTRECSRCGADLLILMRIAVKAYRLREAARQALREDDLPRAVRSAAAAEALHGTAAGRLLWRVGVLLTTEPPSHPGRPPAGT